ncbi:prepilin-type N-terminal cleavage/methylation domain-containing protein [Candidatus Gracilibacteria bacterium]|nr:prepilin-type N-terminal cleavage/methylation domain-containing protein [Candidatus Gracilibacteria bacterium]
MKKILKSKAFTLIELMIVVVILGVLMSTILPKLTGGQARSRDSGRMSDLRNIVSALNVYYDDYGEYPGMQGKSYCLPESGDSTDEKTASHVSGVLQSYLQEGKVPQDMKSSSNSKLCNADGLGKYYYVPLIWNGLDKNSFVLCADVEDYHNANMSVEDDINIIGTDATNADSFAKYALKPDDDTVEKFYKTVTERKFTKESPHGASDSVYCILRSL